jgi:uncharacterized cupredoxin-like copper-binding protein
MRRVPTFNVIARSAATKQSPSSGALAQDCFVAALLAMTGGATVAAFLAPASFAQSQPASRVDWSAAQPITVLLIDDKFVPDHLTFHRAVPYRLHLENHGKDLHEFTAPEFFAASVVRNPGVIANGGQEIVVQPGAAVDVDLVPLKSGTYRLICADHDWAGMTGEITVE